MENQAVIDRLDKPREVTTLSAPAKSRRGPPRSAILLVTAIIGLLHAYVGIRLLPALDLGLAGSVSGIGLLLLSTVMIPLSLLAPMLVRRPGKSSPTALIWSGLLATGFASSLLVLTVLRDLGMLLLMPWLAGSALQNLRTDSAWGVVGLALTFTVLGLINARRTPRIVEVEVPLSDLPPALHGFRIAQISDIHVGPTIKQQFLQRIVDRVNTLDAHLVAITGDLVDGSVAELAPHTGVLKELRSVYGSYFVTGNHEYYSGADAWISELRRLGVTVLQNQHVVLHHAGASLVLAGVSDYSGHHFGEQHRSDPLAALRGAPDRVARILLAHQPRSAPAAEAAGFDLQLSGHTHGGQFFPWNFLVPLQQPFTAGLHRLHHLWVYTSRGTGYWGPPKRLGAPAEITLLRLVRPAASS